MLREQAADQVEVLDKAKEVFLLPKLEMMTMQQLADYYEVEVRTVQCCYQHNRKEILESGAVKLTTKDFKSRNFQCIDSSKTRGCKNFQLSDEVILRVPTSGTIFFPTRAILRVGMLIRNSEVAKRVRTLLLNSFDFVKPEDRFDGSEVLNWGGQPAASAAVKMIANKAAASPRCIWLELHDKLYSEHRINLRTRRNRSMKNSGKPLISFVKDNEWLTVQLCLSEMCKEYWLDPVEVFEKSREAEQ